MCVAIPLPLVRIWIRSVLGSKKNFSLKDFFCV